MIGRRPADREFFRHSVHTSGVSGDPLWRSSFRRGVRHVLARVVGGDLVFCMPLCVRRGAAANQCSGHFVCPFPPHTRSKSDQTPRHAARTKALAEESSAIGVPSRAAGRRAPATAYIRDPCRRWAPGRRAIARKRPRIRRKRHVSAILFGTYSTIPAQPDYVRSTPLGQSATASGQSGNALLGNGVFCMSVMLRVAIFLEDDVDIVWICGPGIPIARSTRRRRRPSMCQLLTCSTLLMFLMGKDIGDMAVISAQCLKHAACLVGDRLLRNDAHSAPHSVMSTKFQMLFRTKSGPDILGIVEACGMFGILAAPPFASCVWHDVSDLSVKKA